MGQAAAGRERKWEASRASGTRQRRVEAGHADPTGLARLQQQIGNREVVRMLGAQTKLEVGRADDPLELEADRAASEVVRAMRTTRAGGVDDGEGLTLRRRADGPIGAEGGELGDDVQRTLDSARAGGVPLPDGVRDGMGTAFGADFSEVRVHAGPVASDLSRQMGATAFTVGRDIFFRDGMPDAGSDDGQHLLAHELAHTVQQGAASVVQPIRRAEHEELEEEDSE